MTVSDGDRPESHGDPSPPAQVAAPPVPAPPVAAAARPAPDSGHARRRWLLPAVLAAVPAVLLGLVVYFGINTISGYRAEHDRGAAVAAGRQLAINLTSFDFTTAERDVQRLQASITSTFANGFTDDKEQFVKTLREDRVRMVGEATEAGLVDYQGDSAHVLVSIKAEVANGARPRPEPRNYRVNVTMVKRDGDWLANAAEFVS